MSTWGGPVDVTLTGGRVVTPDGVLEQGWVAVRDGLIAAVGEGAPPDGPTTDVDGGWLVPGFVDIHCHGGGGEAFTSADPARVVKAANAHRRHGTTTLLASLVSRPIPELADQVKALTELVRDEVVAGIHLEGPFLSAARCGAHDPAILCPPDRASIDRLLDAGGGTVRMITIAPELEHGVDAVRHLVDNDVLAAIGHTDATEAQIRPAVEAGATVATHLFNGMRPLHHREPGPIGALLDDERVTVELICDLVHLHPTAVRLAARHAGVRPDRPGHRRDRGGGRRRRRLRRGRPRGAGGGRRADARGRRVPRGQHADDGRRVPQRGAVVRPDRRGGRARHRRPGPPGCSGCRTAPVSCAPVSRPTSWCWTPS